MSAAAGVGIVVAMIVAYLGLAAIEGPTPIYRPPVADAGPG